MGAIAWSKTDEILQRRRGQADGIADRSGGTWQGFFEALGRIESDLDYSARNGIYREGKGQASNPAPAARVASSGSR